MLKLHQYFFRATVGLAVTSVVLAAISGFYFIKNHEIDSTIRNLKNTLDLALANDALDDRYLGRIAQTTKHRVTYIDSSGKVLFDSMHNPYSMDNHKNRPEITASIKADFGVSVRDSKTLNRTLVYVSKKSPSGYLRFSTPLQNIYNKTYELVGYLLLFLIVILWALLFVSSRMNKSIMEDSQKIDNALESLLNREFSIYIHDIGCCSEFNQIAKKLTKIAKRLKKREKQKTKYTKRLQELTRRQGDIISAISHEFKNPVAAIVGYVETIKDTTDLDKELKSTFLDKIENNAIKISSMIDVLSLSIKLESQSIVLNLEDINLADVIKHAKEVLEPKYKGREIIIECSELVLSADRAMLENVFINLIENALKYSEEDVVIECSNSRVDVVDRGIGIDQSDIQKIKKKFYRVDGVSWNNSMGVGLYIVDYLLKLHDTELEIKSNDTGSSFGFSFEHIAKKKF